MSRMIYHLALPDAWSRAAGQAYRAESLASEGFIHCAYREQVEWAANRFYASAPELLLVCIDPSRLASPVRDEDAGTGERFPHIYGPIEPGAVLSVENMTRGAEGRWVLPKTPR